MLPDIQSQVNFWQKIVYAIIKAILAFFFKGNRNSGFMSVIIIIIIILTADHTEVNILTSDYAFFGFGFGVCLEYSSNASVSLRRQQV